MHGKDISLSLLIQCCLNMRVQKPVLFVCFALEGEKIAGLGACFNIRKFKEIKVIVSLSQFFHSISKSEPMLGVFTYARHLTIPALSYSD